MKKDKRLNIRICSDDYEKIKEFANKQELSVSSYIAEASKNYDSLCDRIAKIEDKLGGKK